jgi:CelD/BcsL family acetyltransferase involved in cellulose biosynthesis
MNIVVEKSSEAIGRERWNSIVSQNATNSVFQTYEWHRAFEATYSSNHLGYILCGMEGNELVGIAPFCLCRKRKESIVRFLGYERADYCDFIYLRQKKEFIAEVFLFLKKNRAKWDRIELNNIPQHSPTQKFVPEACALFRLFPCKSKMIPCPALLFKDKDRPCEEMLGKKSLVRHQKYFSKKPDYRVSHFVRGEEIAARLPLFFNQHIARWSVTAFPSLFLSPCHQEFYRNLARELDASSWVLFTEIISDGRPVAFHFGFRYNGKLVWYKPTFDILLSKHSPGEALLKELMLFVEKNGLDELDYSIGDEAFKRRFSNIIRYNVSFDIFNRPAKYALYIIRRFAKTALDKLPFSFRRKVFCVLGKFSMGKKEP